MKNKILVVDDESRMRKLVKDFLQRENYEVLEAENGEDVIIAIAVYNGNKLTDVDFRIFKDHTGQAKAEIKAGAGCAAKAFLWRGGSFAPLYKSIDVR